MKELIALKDKYLEDYDVHVKCYLTYDQIQDIVMAVSNCDNFNQREQTKDYLLLTYATDIPHEEIDKLGPDDFLTSGLTDCVKSNIENLCKIDEGIAYQESISKIIRDMAKMIPDDLGDKLKEFTQVVGEDGLSGRSKS